MLKTSTAPHLREAQQPAYQSFGVLLCMIPLTAFACIHYGFRPLLLVVAGIVGSVLTECLCRIFMKGRTLLIDATALVTGALIGAMMSPLAPFWVPIIGASLQREAYCILKRQPEESGTHAPIQLRNKYCNITALGPGY